MINETFWKNYDEVTNMLKQAFIQMPGGQAQDKQAQDPTAGGAMPPQGMDPAAMGGDPAAMGMPPPGMDPSMMGASAGLPPTGLEDPTAMPNAAPGSPMITISLDQLFEIIQKVLGLAKKVGANGSGIPQQQAAPEAQGLTQDQLKATIYEALGGIAG